MTNKKIEENVPTILINPEEYKDLLSNVLSYSEGTSRKLIEVFSWRSKLLVVVQKLVLELDKATNIIQELKNNYNLSLEEKNKIIKELEYKLYKVEIKKNEISLEKEDKIKEIAYMKKELKNIDNMLKNTQNDLEQQYNIIYNIIDKKDKKLNLEEQNTSELIKKNESYKKIFTKNIDEYKKIVLSSKSFQDSIKKFIIKKYSEEYKNKVLAYEKQNKVLTKENQKLDNWMKTFKYSIQKSLESILAKLNLNNFNIEDNILDIAKVSWKWSSFIEKDLKYAFTKAHIEDYQVKTSTLYKKKEEELKKSQKQLKKLEKEYSEMVDFLQKTIDKKEGLLKENEWLKNKLKEQEKTIKELKENPYNMPKELEKSLIVLVKQWFKKQALTVKSDWLKQRLEELDKKNKQSDKSKIKEYIKNLDSIIW